MAGWKTNELAVTSEAINVHLGLDRGAHEYTGSSGYSQKQGHRDWLLIKGNRKRKVLSVGEWVLLKTK